MTIDQLLAEVEPVAWRYRYLDGGKWNVQKNKPNWSRDFMPDVELEPLFSAATLTYEREAREKAEAERDRLEQNRDMWRGQCDRQSKALDEMRGNALARIKEGEDK